MKKKTNEIRKNDNKLNAIIIEIFKERALNSKETKRHKDRQNKTKLKSHQLAFKKESDLSTHLLVFTCIVPVCSMQQ
jgi:hypothetical protein